MSKQNLIFITDNFNSYCTLVTKVIQKQPLDRIYFTQKSSRYSKEMISLLNPWLRFKGYPEVITKPVAALTPELASCTDLAGDQIDVVTLMIAKNQCSHLSIRSNTINFRQYPNCEHWDSDFFHGVLGLAGLPDILKNKILQSELRGHIRQLRFKVPTLARGAS